MKSITSISNTQKVAQLTEDFSPTTVKIPNRTPTIHTNILSQNSTICCRLLFIRLSKQRWLLDVIMLKNECCVRLLLNIKGAIHPLVQPHSAAGAALRFTAYIALLAASLVGVHVTQPTARSARLSGIPGGSDLAAAVAGGAGYHPGPEVEFLHLLTIAAAIGTNGQTTHPSH
jgi:hypothetical protein